MAKKRFSRSFYVPETNEELSPAGNNHLKEYIRKVDNEVKAWIDLKKNLLLENSKLKSQSQRRFIGLEDVKQYLKPSEYELWRKIDNLNLKCNNINDQLSEASENYLLFINSYKSKNEILNTVEENKEEFIKNFENALCKELDSLPDILRERDFEISPDDLRDEVSYLNDYDTD